MKVEIKKFDVKMEVKTNGIELDISGSKGKHIGDLFVTKRGVVWCKGKTSRNRGCKIKWTKLIQAMENVTP